MNTSRLVVLCVAVSLVCGGIGAWVVGSVYPNLVAQKRVGDLVSAQSAPKIANLIDEEHATIQVVNDVTPAVVSVIARSSRAEVLKSYRAQAAPSDLIFSDISLSETEAKQQMDVSSGTGFFVSHDGFILTNRHVVEVPHTSLFIVTNEGKELPAKLVDTDPVLDIAMLRVEGTDFPIVTLADSDQIKIGQTVIAIGNTLSEFRNTVTKGVVSGINRRVTAGLAISGSEVIEKAIQTDAAINPGNSGGPLINLVGEVIGVNAAMSVDGQAVAFAIPINQVKRAIEDVKTLGHIARPWLGINYVLITGETSVPSFSFGTKLTKGEGGSKPAVVSGGPADLAGLKEGDILIAVDDEVFTQGKTLAELVTPHRSRDQIRVRYIRDRTIQETVVTLGDAP